MNYFRSSLVQRITCAWVAVALLFAVAVPISHIGLSAKDRAAVQLFGKSLDIPVDKVFLSTWQVALHSDVSTLTGFVEVFVQSYENANDIEVGSIPKDAHALWSILRGISLNIDPWGLTATLVSSLKSAPVSATTKSGGFAELSDRDRTAARHCQLALKKVSTTIVVRSMLTAINPQGP